jgi:hypothetical protein
MTRIPRLNRVLICNHVYSSPISRTTANSTILTLVESSFPGWTAEAE